MSKGAKIDNMMGTTTRHIAGSVQMQGKYPYLVPGVYSHFESIDVQQMMMEIASDMITATSPKELLRCLNLLRV